MYSPNYSMSIPQFLDHCRLNFSYTLSFTPGCLMLLSQDHTLHQSNIPELDVQSRLLHADIPQFLDHCRLNFSYTLSFTPGCLMFLSQDHTLHQSNIPELDVQSRLLHADIPQFLDHCHLNSSYTLSFTPGYSILLSQNHMLHHSKIPEINVRSRLLHADTKHSWINAVPTFPTHYPLHPKILDAAVTRPMLMPVKFPQLDLESRLRLVHAC